MTVAELKKFKDSCYSALSRDITEFEKNFLFISAGILAFSTTFIKDIVKIQDAQELWLLFGSWFFIVIAIAIMMIAYLKSATASDKLWQLVDDYLVENELYQDATELSKTQWLDIKPKVNRVFYENKSALKRFRAVAVITFLTGIILFSIFVSLNIAHERTQSPKAENKTNHK